MSRHSAGKEGAPRTSAVSPAMAFQYAGSGLDGGWEGACVRAELGLTTGTFPEGLSPEKDVPRIQLTCSTNMDTQPAGLQSGKRAAVVGQFCSDGSMDGQNILSVCQAEPGKWGGLPSLYSHL